MDTRWITTVSDKVHLFGIRFADYRDTARHFRDLVCGRGFDDMRFRGVSATRNQASPQPLLPLSAAG